MLKTDIVGKRKSDVNLMHEVSVADSYLARSFVLLFCRTQMDSLIFLYIDQKQDTFYSYLKLFFY